jgi:hypothetical protein
MQVKYSWRAKTDDPDEVISLTVDDEFVPRVGDHVELEVPIYEDRVDVYGVVRLVVYSRGMAEKEIRVYLE